MWNNQNIDWPCRADQLAFWETLTSCGKINWLVPAFLFQFLNFPLFKGCSHKFEPEVFKNVCPKHVCLQYLIYFYYWLHFC